jgi:DNA-binding response OmpR family regulator
MSSINQEPLHGYKLLLVEDDKSIVEGLEYYLSQEGFQVTCCYDMASTMEILEKNTFDIAILDLSLPDGSGYDICLKIKNTNDIPIIFLTARDDEGSTVMGLDMGADDYITKPFRIRELHSRIKSVLRRYGKGKDNNSEDILTFGNIEINLKEGNVRKNGNIIFLTALEYRLFLTLCQNKGRILTRSQLLESIWDVSGDFVNDNTLTVYIKRLRDKIEDDPQNPTIIKTVRGLGYQVQGNESL